jgi:hypothetical protein
MHMSVYISFTIFGASVLVYAVIGVVVAAWISSGGSGTSEDEFCSRVLGVFWPALAFVPFFWAGSKLFNATTRFLKRPKLPKATALQHQVPPSRRA